MYLGFDTLLMSRQTGASHYLQNLLYMPLAHVHILGNSAGVGNSDLGTKHTVAAKSSTIASCGSSSTCSVATITRLMAIRVAPNSVLHNVLYRSPAVDFVHQCTNEFARWHPLDGNLGLPVFATGVVAAGIVDGGVVVGVGGTVGLP